MGIYTTIISWYAIADTICGAGMRSFLTRDIARDLTKTNCYMIHAAIVTSGISLLVNIIVMIMITQLPVNYVPETIWSIIIANISLFPATWSTIYESAFIAHQRAEFVTYTMLLILFARVIGSIYLLLNGHSVLSLIVLQVVLQYIAFGISTVFVVRHIVKPHWEFNPIFLKEMLMNLRVFTPIGFLSSMFSQIEVQLLSWLQGESAVGIFGAASKLTMMWIVIPDSYMRAMFPAMAAAYTRSKQEFQQMVNRSVKYMMALAFPLAVGIAVTANRFIPLFYGEGFDASVPVLQFLAIILVPIFLNEILWRILITRDEQHLALSTQIAGVIVKVGVSLLAVPLFSQMGTVYSLLASQLIYTSMHIFFVQRRGTPTPFVSLIWRFALAAALMGGCAWWLSAYINLGGEILNIAVMVTAAMVVYAALLFLLRAFTSEDLDLFRSFLRRRGSSTSGFAGKK